MSPINQTPAWRALEAHWQAMSSVHMRDLFERDPGRGERYTLEHAGILLDYSKNRITDETMRRLQALVGTADVPSWRDAMLRGDAVNNTEQRAVLHMALRNRGDRPYETAGEDVMPGIRGVLERLGGFAEQVRDGRWLGFTGRRITDVVNIGIGGSSLGPKMVCEALAPYGRQDLRAHFVSNVDAMQLVLTLEGLDPETTLFIIASKTFTTLETLRNAHTARDWTLKALGDDAAIARHFVAVSTNREAVSVFGIDPANMFEFWDWVGGRYSLWSAIGLPIAIAIGMDNFVQLLEGAYQMDEHFIAAPPEESMPFILALLGIWYSNFANADTHAVIPYDQNLANLPTYLQQVDKESNGKRVTRGGLAIDYATGPVVWGQPGTDAQHSFFQLIHQGKRLVPVDFILPLQSKHELLDHHDKLVANCFAQAQALMRGKTLDEVHAELVDAGLDAENVERLTPHKVFPGNRPSNLILLDQLTPATLGALIALYEHKVFIQGVIWGVDSFDQWGVELGKQLAGRVLDAFDSGALADADSSTQAVIARYRKARR